MKNLTRSFLLLLSLLIVGDMVAPMMAQAQHRHRRHHRPYRHHRGHR